MRKSVRERVEECEREQSETMRIIYMESVLIFQND